MSYIYLVTVPGSSTRVSVTADLVQIHHDGSLAFYKLADEKELSLSYSNSEPRGHRLVRAWGAGRWTEMEEHEPASAGTTTLHKGDAS